MKNRLLLGISGSIAAYKSPHLLRLLQQDDWQVKVVLSEGGAQFVSRLSLASLNAGQVYGASCFGEKDSSPLLHIDLANWAEVILIAPCSANLMARLSSGQASDLLSCIVLASKAPLFLAPSMNENMWLHPATQANKEKLQSWGVRFLGPDKGEQACGLVGLGRMRELELLLKDLRCWRQEGGLLKGLKILISAGGTQEPIDPVRFIANRSSGKMGYALAEMAQQMGAQVTLVSAPTHLSCPAHVQRVSVRTAEQMRESVLRLVADCHIYVSAAAISDWCVETYSSHKIKRTEKTFSLNLIAQEDILLTVSRLDNPPFLVGFCAETQDLAKNAQAKRLAKRLPVVIANLVGEGPLGFDSDENEVLFLCEQSQEFIERQNKRDLARILWKKIKESYCAYSLRSPKNP